MTEFKPNTTASQELAALKAELTETRARLKDSQDQLSFLTQQTLLPILTIQDKKVVYANQAFADLMGVPLDRVMAMSSDDIIDLVDPDFRSFARDQAIRKMAGQNQGVVEQYQYRAMDAKGKPGWVTHYSSTVRFKGRPANMACMISITKQKRAERALQKANEIINNSPAVAFVWKNQPGWPVAFVSQNVARLLEYPASEFLEKGLTYSQVIFPKDLEQVVLEVEAFSADKEKNSFPHKPYRIVTRSGQIKWVDDRTFVKRDDQGEITQYQGVIQDITEQKLAQDMLKESEDRCRSIIENAADAFFAHKMDGRFCHVNRKACEDSGYTEKELLEMTVDDIQAGGWPKKMKLLWKRIHDGFPVRGVAEIMRKDGSYYPAEITASSFEGVDGPEIFGFCRDMTAHKKAEAEKEHLITELKKALDEVKQLSGLLPICAQCKKIRDDKGYWNYLENYIEAHSLASFSHGICPECMEDLYGKDEWYIKQNKKGED